MNVLYCGDRNIEDGVMLSLLSLLKNAGEPLNIYIMTMELATGQKLFHRLPPSLGDFLDRKVKEADPRNSVRLIDVTKLFLKEIPTANLETRFTPMCMLRLFADLLPELPDRLLYLDNDVICRKLFFEFYHQDMTECELAGVLDYYGSWFFRRRFWERDYLNSGVLLLNLKEIRKTGLFQKCRELCVRKKMFMPDQSALNKLANSKKILPRKYNEQRKLRKDTVFQHFTTSFRFFPYFHSVTVKPWHTEKMHSVLKLYEYDSLLTEYEGLKAEYSRTE